MHFAEIGSYLGTLVSNMGSQMMKFRAIDGLVACVAVFCMANICSEVYAQCYCSKKCYQYTGEGSIVPVFNDIACTQNDPFEAYKEFWCNNVDCIGGTTVPDGIATFTAKTCDYNSCQLYCLSCGLFGDNMQSDPPGVATGCVKVGDYDRHKCAPGS